MKPVTNACCLLAAASFAVAHAQPSPAKLDVRPPHPTTNDPLAEVVPHGQSPQTPIATNQLSYQGRSLSEWLKDFDAPDKSALAAEAIRHIGAPAVPMLLDQLDPAKEKQFIHETENWRTQMQDAAEGVELPRPPNPRRQALAAIDALGSAAEAALPTLEKMLRENPPDPRILYVAARIGPASIPLLRRCLTNEVAFDPKLFRLEAKVCLGMLATRSKPLYPQIPVGPEAPCFDRRICEFNAKVLSAAFQEHKAEHPEMREGDTVIPMPPAPPR